MSVVVLLVSWALISVVAGLWFSAEARKSVARRGEQDAAFTELLAAVETNLYESQPKCDVYDFCRCFPRFTSSAYRFALRIVAKSNGDAEAKRFALALGRMQCAQGSDSGRVAIYDEQMIQAEIAVQISNGRIGSGVV